MRILVLLVSVLVQAKDGEEATKTKVNALDKVLDKLEADVNAMSLSADKKLKRLKEQRKPDERLRGADDQGKKLTESDKLAKQLEESAEQESTQKAADLMERTVQQEQARERDSAAQDKKEAELRNAAAKQYETLKNAAESKAFSKETKKLLSPENMKSLAGDFAKEQKALDRDRAKREKSAEAALSSKVEKAENLGEEQQEQVLSDSTAALKQLDVISDISKKKRESKIQKQLKTMTDELNKALQSDANTNGPALQKTKDKPCSSRMRQVEVNPLVSLLSELLGDEGTVIFEEPEQRGEVQDSMVLVGPDETDTWMFDAALPVQFLQGEVELGVEDDDTMRFLQGNEKHHNGKAEGHKDNGKHNHKKHRGKKNDDEAGKNNRNGKNKHKSHKNNEHRVRNPAANAKHDYSKKKISAHDAEVTAYSTEAKPVGESTAVPEIKTRPEIDGEDNLQDDNRPVHQPDQESCPDTTPRPSLVEGSEMESSAKHHHSEHKSGSLSLWQWLYFIVAFPAGCAIVLLALIICAR